MEGNIVYFFFRNLVYRENVDRKIAISLVDLAGLKNRDALYQGISSISLRSDILCFCKNFLPCKPVNIFYFVYILVIAEMHNIIEYNKVCPSGL